MAAAKGVTIAQTDFPLYTVRFVGDRHFLAAGGGGAAKTGVPNALVRYDETLCYRPPVIPFTEAPQRVMPEFL